MVLVMYSRENINVYISTYYTYRSCALAETSVYTGGLHIPTPFSTMVGDSSLYWYVSYAVFYLEFIICKKIFTKDFVQFK